MGSRSAHTGSGARWCGTNRSSRSGDVRLNLDTEQAPSARPPDGGGLWRWLAGGEQVCQGNDRGSEAAGLRLGEPPPTRRTPPGGSQNHPRSSSRCTCASCANATMGSSLCSSTVANSSRSLRCTKKKSCLMPRSWTGRLGLSRPDVVREMRCLAWTAGGRKLPAPLLRVASQASSRRPSSTRPVISGTPSIHSRTAKTTGEPSS